MLSDSDEDIYAVVNETEPKTSPAPEVNLDDSDEELDDESIQIIVFSTSAANYNRPFRLMGASVLMDGAYTEPALSVRLNRRERMQKRIVRKSNHSEFEVLLTAQQCEEKIGNFDFPEQDCQAFNDLYRSQVDDYHKCNVEQRLIWYQWFVNEYGAICRRDYAPLRRNGIIKYRRLNEEAPEHIAQELRERDFK